MTRFATEAGRHEGEMRALRRIKAWVGVNLGRSRMESEMEAELRFHIAARAEDLMREGSAGGRGDAQGAHRVWRDG
jgi:hypothetical protein